MNSFPLFNRFNCRQKIVEKLLLMIFLSVIINNTNSKQFMWIYGSDSINRYASYGTKGVANPNNNPGSRKDGVSWIDSSNNLFLFGGFTYYPGGSFNDLWKFDGVNWVWISGSNELEQKGIYGEKGIADSKNVPGGRYHPVSWIDSSNNLYLFGGFGFDNSSMRGALNDLWKFDGTNWSWISGSYKINDPGNYAVKGADLNNIPCARNGAVSWIDSSNNLYLFGGNAGGAKSYGKLNDLWKFDGTIWTWISGSEDINQFGHYGSIGTADLNNIPGARENAMSWIDSSNNMYLFGGFGYSESSSGYVEGYLNDLWRFDGTHWTWISGSKDKNQPGHYGIKGDPFNTPGGRYLGITWIDSSNNLYLFGGYGYDEKSYGIIIFILFLLV
jgi:hypothetical protein